MPEALSPDELVAAMASEIAAALAATDTGETMRVTRVVARIGEPSGSFEDVAWQAELTIDPTPPAGRPTTPPAPGRPKAPEATSALPVTAINGASTVWSARLEKAGITTVGNLAETDQPTLTTLAKRHRSRHVFTLAARARLATMATLPKAIDSPVTIGDAITMDPASLAEHLRLDPMELTRLLDALSLLTASLDTAVLARTKLSSLT